MAKKQKWIVEDLDINDGLETVYYTPKVETKKKNIIESVGSTIGKTFKDSNALKDGYNPLKFELTKTIGSTALDLGLNFTKGVANIGESAGKFAAQKIGEGIGNAGNKLLQVGSAFGIDTRGISKPLINKSEQIDNRIAGKDEQFNKNQSKFLITNALQSGIDIVDKNSIAGSTTDAASQGLGYISGMLALQSIGVPWQATAGMTSYQSAYEEALKNGATKEQATTSGIISAGAEIISENIFNGIKLPGTGKTTEALIEKATGKIGNKAMQYIVRTGIAGLGEGTEEIISGFIDAVGKKITYMGDKKLKEIYSSDQALEDFVVGTFTSLLSNANTNVHDIRSILTEEQTNKGQSIETETNTEAQNKPNGNVNIEQNVQNNQNIVQNNQNIPINSNLSTNIVENTNTRLNESQIEQLNNDIKSLEKEIAQQEKLIKQLTENNENTEQVDLDRVQLEQNKQELAKLKEIRDYQTSIKSPEIAPIRQDIQNKVNVPINEELINKKAVNRQIQDNIPIKAVSNEKLNQNATEMTKTNGIDYVGNNKFIQSAINNGININYEGIQSLNELFAQRGIEAIFDNSKFSNANDEAFWSIDNEGKRRVTLNPNANSNKLIQNIAIHELTHDILSSSSKYLINQQEILNYLSKFEGYEKARKSLENSYASERNGMSEEEFQKLIDEEIIASSLGQKLGNQEFVNRLVREKPNMARQIYNWVKTKVQNLFSSKSTRQERNFWNKIKNNFDKAYRQEYNRAANEEQTRNAKSSDIARKLFPNDMTIDDYIYDDPRKADFKRYSSNKDYFKLPYKVMDEISARVSQESHKAVRGDNVYMRMTSEVDGNDYAIYSDVFNDDDYSITNVEKIKGDVVQDVNERIEKQNNGLYNRYARDDKGLSNTNIESTRYSRTSTEDAGISTKQQEGIINKSNNQEIIRNSRKELDNSSFSLKQKQFEIIQNSNPMQDDYHTGIRNIGDIKALQETLEDSDWSDYDEFNPDLTRQDIENAINKGIITVYSSYPIENGVFVSPSKMEAESYSGDGKIYSQEVNINDVAWIDPTQGQFAKVEINQQNKQATDNQGRKLTKQQQEYFKDSKVRDENGNLLEVYHGTWNDFTIFDRKYLGSGSGDVGFLGDGFYFATHDGEARYYGSKSMAVYLDVKNPYNIKDLRNYNGEHFEGENSNTYIEIKNLVDMNDEWRIIKANSPFDVTYGEIADAVDDVINSIDVVEAGRDAENYKQFKVTINDRTKFVSTIDSYNVDNVKADAMYDEMRNMFGYIESSDVIQSITYESNFRRETGGEPIKSFSEILQELGYDGIFQGETASVTDEIVVFNSNQIKNVDNLNPTTNEDIRKSKSNSWQDFLDKNIQKEGTGKTINEIKFPSPKQKVEPPIKETKRDNIPMKKQDNVLKVESKDIADSINRIKDINMKESKWKTSALLSETFKDKKLVADLNIDELNYVIDTNQDSLDRANGQLASKGYEESLKYVQNLIESDKMPTPSDVVLAQRVLQEAIKNKDTEVVQDLLMDISILGTDLGKATQALYMIQKMTPEGQLKMYGKLVERAKAKGEKSFKDVKITPEMVENVLSVYNEDGSYDQNELNAKVEEFKQDIANQMKATVGEKANAWRYLAMLGNPKTHIRNIVSNVAMKGAIKVKNAMARTLESIVPIRQEYRTKTWKKASKEIQDFASKTADEYKGIITGEDKYNEKSSLEQKKKIFGNKFIEAISNKNGDLLEGEDWFFSRNAFKNTLQEYLTAQGINTLEDVQNNQETVQKGILYATEQAEIATFRQYSKLASSINSLEKKSKIGKIFIEATVPFKKTPINVAKAGLNYSPLGLIKNVSYDIYQLKNGNINASQFIDNLSQGMTGTSLALIGYALAKAGFLHGAGNDDKEDKYDQQLGKQTYSLNIGGQSYSISWLSPVAMPLLVGANAYEKLEENEDWDMNIVSDTLAETLDPLTEMSFISGLTNVLKSYKQGSAQMVKSIGETSAQSYVMQFFPTLFSQIASTLDDKKRSTKASNNSEWKFGEETLRKIMLKIPGLRNKLEVQTDIWGNEKEQADNIIQRAFENFISPYSRTQDISTNIDKEIKKVYNETANTGVIPNIPNAYTKYDGETYRMSASEYTEYKKLYGQTSSKSLNELFKESSYKEASYEDKAKMIDNVYDYAREKAKTNYLSSIDVDYSSKNNEKIDSLVDKYKINVGTYYANKKEYDYAYQYPAKYGTIKQITDYKKYVDYKDKLDDIRKNTKDDKNETVKYINSLSLNVPQKAMFIKQYYKSFKQYDKQIIQYINSQNISKQDKMEILENLGFTIKNGRVY